MGGEKGRVNFGVEDLFFQTVDVHMYENETCFFLFYVKFSYTF